MHTELKESLLRQIEETLGYQKIMRAKGQYDDLSGLDNWEYDRFITMALAAIERATGRDSVYMQQAKDAEKTSGRLDMITTLPVSRPWLAFWSQFAMP